MNEIIVVAHPQQSLASIIVSLWKGMVPLCMTRSPRGEIVQVPGLDRCVFAHLQEHRQRRIVLCLTCIEGPEKAANSRLDLEMHHSGKAGTHVL